MSEATQKKPPKSSEPKIKIKTFQKFQSGVAKRSQLHEFEANPRSIDKSASRKLRETLKKTGLVEPIVVNRRLAANGFEPEQDGMLTILGGHQRTRCMDDLTGFDAAAPESDYDIPIALVEVAPAREKEIVISLNNSAMQGGWDFNLLEQLLSDPDVSVAATGFERADLGMMFDEGILDGIFGASATEQAAAEAPLINMLEEMRQTGKAMDKAAASGMNPGSVALTSDAQVAVKQGDAHVAELKNAREKYYANENRQDQNDTDYYIVLVGENATQIDRFLAKLNLGIDKRYIPLIDVAAALGIELEQGE